MGAASFDVERDARKQMTLLVVAALKQTASLSNGVEVADYLLDALRALDADPRADPLELETHHEV